jgi:hypothetical protein
MVDGLKSACGAFSGHRSVDREQKAWFLPGRAASLRGSFM